jgi:hypothetical protein
MKHLSDDFDLAEEAIGGERPAELRAEDFHGDFPPVAHIFGEVDGRHAARTELALDTEVVG